MLIENKFTYIVSKTWLLKQMKKWKCGSVEISGGHTMQFTDDVS